MTGFTLVPQGSFSLKESVEFGFGQRHSERYAGSMRLAFVLDGYAGPAGAVLRQDVPDGPVVGEVVGDADPALVERQVARILSLDQDGTPYDEIGGRDPVIARLQQVRPGQRPPLFHSPYEAALWAIISTRRPAAVATRLREELARVHGSLIEVDGVPMPVVPTPAQLLEVDSVAGEVSGLPADRVERLHALARFALDGGLDALRLREMGADEAAEWVQRVPGIGPFYASLITLRATGFADVLPTAEPRFVALVRQLYGLASEPGAEELEAIAEPWQPRRTWAAVLVRAAGPTLLEKSGAA